MPVDPLPLKDVFTEALARPDPADRAAYLEAACGGDEDLRSRVEALLRASEHPDSFLDDLSPPGPADATGPADPAPPHAAVTDTGALGPAAGAVVPGRGAPVGGGGRGGGGAGLPAGGTGARHR